MRTSRETAFEHVRPAAADVAQRLPAALPTAGRSRRSVAFFGYDRSDTTIVKRATAFVANGCEVTGLMFRRLRGMEPSALPFPCIDLGATVDRSYLKRLPRLAAGLAIILRQAPQLRRCRIFYARNLDMLALAVAARTLTRADAIVVYEALDVNRTLLGAGRRARVMRALERALLARSDLLVVSSPAYIDHYFRPQQGYAGAWHLLENKLHAAQLAGVAGRAPSSPPPGPPWIIGWYGVLKCRRSLDILTRVATRLGEKVRIVIRGIPSSSDVPSQLLDEVCRSHSNIVFGGPYVAPRDLPELYEQVHFVWAADFLDAGGNSDWCLANRIYEGGYFGAVVIACATNFTGQTVAREGLGWALPEPLEETAPQFLERMSSADYVAARRRLEAKAKSLFVDIGDTAALLDRLDELVAERGSKLPGL